MEPGGELTTITRSEHDHVMLDISDTGKGIPQEVWTSWEPPF